MAGLHAKFSPSSAERVLLCPASFKANLGRHSTTSWFAVEGTIAHYIHGHVMDGSATLRSYLGLKPESFMAEDELHDDEWAVVPPDFIVDQDMLDYVQTSIDWCQSLVASSKIDGMYVETQVSIDNYTPETEDKQFGTCDVGLVYRDGTLVVADLKYGRGVKVDAPNNPQLALYALGFIDKFDDLYAFDRVLVAVSQPRLGHFDVWETTVNELRLFGALIKQSFELALTEDPPYNASEKGCKFCAFKSECPELYRLTLDMFDDISPVGGSVPQGTSAERVADMMNKRSMIRDYLDAIEERAESMLLHDLEVPGYKLVEGRSSRVWNKDDDDIIAFLESIEVDPFTEPKLISVAQAEKLAGKKNKPQLTELVNKLPGRPTVALETDKRSRWTNNVDMFDVL